MKKKVILGVIGGGFMANAIVRGAIETKYLAPEEITVSEPDAEKRAVFTALGISVTDDNRAVADNCSYLLLAVKPQTLPAIANALGSAKLPVVISIMAGKTKSNIANALYGANKIARVMPNLPCSVGEGMSGIDALSLGKEEREFVVGLFSSVGKTVEVDERLLNAVTGVSGSGPAYVYLFLQSLIESGIREGLSFEQAKTLALQTVRGGVRMAETSEKSLADLIDAVSSKGGTTVAALESFNKDGFSEIVCRGVSAAVRRAEELSR